MQCRSYTHEFCSRSSPRSLRWRSERGWHVAKSSGASALPSGTYKIGFVESKTGRLAFYDMPFYQGLKQVLSTRSTPRAASAASSSSRSITEDGKSDPAQGAVVASDLINQNVQFGITPCDADIGIPGSHEVPGRLDPGRDGVRVRLDVPEYRRQLRLHQRVRNRCARCGPGRVRGEAGLEEGLQPVVDGVLLRQEHRRHVCGSLQAARRQDRRDGLLQVRRHRLPRPRDPDRGQEARRRHLDDRAPRLHDLPQAAPRSGLQGAGAGRRFVRHQRDAGGRKRPQQRVVHDPRLPDGSEDGAVLRRGQEAHRQGARRSDRRDRRRPGPVDQGGAAQGRKRRSRPRFAMRSRA